MSAELYESTDECKCEHLVRIRGNVIVIDRMVAIEGKSVSLWWWIMHVCVKVAAGKVKMSLWRPFSACTTMRPWNLSYCSTKASQEWNLHVPVYRSYGAPCLSLRLTACCLVLQIIHLDIKRWGGSMAPIICLKSSKPPHLSWFLCRCYSVMLWQGGLTLRIWWLQSKHFAGKRSSGQGIRRRVSTHSFQQDSPVKHSSRGHVSLAGWFFCGL